MIERVSHECITFADLPYRLEAGTPNIAGVDWLWCGVRLAQKWNFQAAEAHAVALAEQSKVRLKLSELSFIQFHRNQVQWYVLF